LVAWSTLAIIVASRFPVGRGEAMNEMTPEVLKDWIEQSDSIDLDDARRILASWEADIQKGANIATELARQLRTAEARIEALEKMLNIERLAALIHDEWVTWSQTLAERGEVIAEKIERWRAYWVPYVDLPAPVKEQDREWARKVAALAAEEEKP
jgi:hypothetical protein